MVNRLTGLRKRLSAKVFMAISLLTFSLTIFTSIQVQAKPNPNPFINPSDNQSSIVYAPITLDGQEILHIAAMKGTISNLNQNTISPIEIRIRMYEQNLNEILSTGFYPQKLYVIPAQSEQQTVILVGDRAKLSRRKLMSVTELDAQLHGLSVADLAQQFSSNIRPALIKARQDRLPQSLQRKGLFSFLIIIGLILLSLFLISRYKSFGKNWDRLQEEKPQMSQFAIEEENSEEEDVQMMHYCQQKLIWQRKLNINRLKIWILVISLFLSWVLGLAAIAGMFPYTRWLEDWLLTKPLLLAIILGTILGIKFSTVIIDFLF
ncbi:MAG: hypothetical protein WBA07_25275, partial [Rivularia sp. (in: cyanobacteria)]